MFPLSVIIPTYNSQTTLEKCLSSLISQIHQDFEICIIDGCSVDNTIAIANCYRAHFKNIKILSEPDQGVYDAMNRGIDFASGSWLYFMGSDDEIRDKFVFSDILKIANSEEFELIYGNVFMYGNEDIYSGIYDGSFDLDKLTYQNICHQAIFYKKELFKKFGKYKAKYPKYADWEMNLRLFPRVRSIHIDRIIANFYTGGLSSKDIADPFRAEIPNIRKQLAKRHRLRKLFAPLLLRFHGSVYF